MSAPNTHSSVSFSQFNDLIDAALKEYSQKTGKDIPTHPLTARILRCDSSEAVLAVLQEHAHAFSQYRNGDWKTQLMRRLKPTVEILLGLSNSGVFGQVVGLNFPPAQAIFAGVGLLLAAAKGVSTSYDALIDLFECFEHYLGRLKIFTEIPSAVGEILVKIMVELLGVLALATQQVKQGRFRKFAKKLLGENDIEAVLQRLDRLTMEESRMTAAQTMEVVHGLVNNMKTVMNDGKTSTDNISRALITMQEIVEDVNKIKRGQLQEKVQRWLSPPDPSVNQNIAREAYHSGTATWFIQSSVYNEWKAKGSVLWIHGKPGSGKSVLCSSIIKDVQGICATGLASLAYYYCDFKDVGKQDCRGLLTSLIIQLCARSHRDYDILSSFHAAHDNGLHLRQPSDSDLIGCLKDVLALPGQGEVYIIVDALDECPNTSGFPKLHWTSRPEVDIQIVLEPLTTYQVSLHDESGQREDILNFISTVVSTDRRMWKWRPEDKQLVIDTLSAKADGMFRWVVCQLDMLRRCFPASLRDALDALPETLDETYRRILLGIEKEKREYAHRLLQCLAVSVRPLRVEELAEILAMHFDSGKLPDYQVHWRLEDVREAVLSACSSLVTIANVDRVTIVHFSHFSVKEFLTSDRLAQAGANLSQYRIVSLSAHTIIAQASLSILFYLGNCVDKNNIQDFPFAVYAAQHWVDHGRFEDVSSSIQDAIERLFDLDNPSFATWLWIHDIDYPFREHMFTTQPTRPEAGPLYYATVCGFRDVVKQLLATRPEDVNARGGCHTTALHAALAKGDIGIAELLLEHGANVDALGSKNDWGVLHLAADNGRLDVVEFLLNHHADVNTKGGNGMTPLIVASCMGEFEIGKMLLRHGAALDSQDNNGWTPLHGASRYRHLDIARLIIQSGAAIDSRQKDGWTPLFVASVYGYLDIAELMVQSGAAVDSRQKDGWTPLSAASNYGHLDIVRLLIQNGATLDSRKDDGCTPLFLASHYGFLDIVQLLIQSGAAVDSRQNEGWTPLFPASAFGHMDVVRVLIQSGAAVDSRDNTGWTPLFVSSRQGHRDIVHFLIQSGAVVDSREDKGLTPLMLAAQWGHLDVTQELLDQSADVNAQRADLCTPLHIASTNGHLNVAALMIQCGAGIEKRSRAGETPLNQASGNERIHLDIVRSLLRSGSNPNTQNNMGWTPLHKTAHLGRLDIVKLLLESGAGLDRQNSRNQTPLDVASNNKKWEVAKFLIKSAGGVDDWDDADVTPLDLGSQNSLHGVVPPSLGRGEHVDAPGNTSISLHAVSAQGDLEAVRALLSQGADVNEHERHVYFETPLHAASRNGKLEVAEVLIRHDADVNSRDQYGWTPLLRASRFGHLDVARLLLDHAADLHARDQDNWSSLHMASANGHIQIVQLLLEQGAKVEIRNNEGRTPSDVALRMGGSKIAELLSQHHGVR